MDLKKLKIILFLLVVVIICFIGIIFISSKRNLQSSNSIFAKAVEGTKWPSGDIPLISKEGLYVEDFGEYTCQATIDSGVTYEEFRKYLIELYELGFRSTEEYGTENPNRLVESVIGTGITELTWIAEKDNYFITVLWAQEGAVNEFDIPYEYNFDMNLFINPSDSLLNSNNTENNDDRETFYEDFGNETVSGEWFKVTKVTKWKIFWEDFVNDKYKEK